MQKLRTVLLVFLATFLVIAALLAGGYFFVGSPSGNSSLVRLINNHARWQGGYLRVAGVFLDPAKQLQCESVQIADANGTWLHLQHVDLKWRIQFFPLRITFSSAHIAKMHLARLPQPSQQDTEPFFLSLPRLPGLPVEFCCPDIVVRQIILDQKLTGRELGYQFQGHLTFAPELTTIQAELSGHSANMGSAGLQLRYIPKDELSLQANVREPAGGMLGKALNMPRGMEISANGQGRLADWQGTVNISAPDWGKITNTFRLAGTEKDVAVRLDSQIGFGPKLAELKEWLGKSPTLYLETTLSKDKIVCKQFCLTSLAGKVRLDGTFYPNRVQANLLADIGDISRLKQEFFMDIAPNEPARVSISGPYSKMNVTASIGAEYFKAPEFNARQIKADFSGTLVPGRKKMLAGDLRFTCSKMTPHLLQYHDIQLTSWLQSSFTDLILSRTTIRSRELVLACEEPVVIDEKGICAAGRLVVNRYDAASLSPYLGQGWTGNITGYVDVQGCNADQRFDLLLKSTDLYSPYLQLKDLVGKKILLSGSGTLTPSNIKWEKARLTTQGSYVFCTGEVDWDINRLNIRTEGKILSLPLLHRDIQGQAHIKSRIQGNLSYPDLRMTLKSSKIDYAGKSIHDFVLRTEFDSRTQKGKLTADLQHLQEPVHFYTVFKQKEKSFQLLQASLVGFDAQANIFGHLFYGTLHGDIGLQVTSPNLQGIGKLLDIPLHGSIKGEATCRWQQEKISGQFQIHGNNTGLTAASKGRAEIKGKIAGSLTRPQIHSSGQVYNFALSDTDILHKTVFDLKGEKKSAQASFKVLGRSLFPFSVSSLIKIKPETDGARISVTSLQGKIGPEVLRLKFPAALVFSPKKTILTPVQIQFGQGDIDLEGRLENENIILNGKLKNISTYLPSVFLPIQEHGEITLQTHISGRLDSPAITSSFRVNQLIPAAASSDKQDFSLSGQAEFHQQQASLVSSFTNGKANLLTVEAHAPVAIDLSRALFTLQDKARASIKGRMELNWVPYMFGLEDHVLNAVSYVDIQALYFDHDFSLQGYGRIKGGKYEFLPVGTVLRNLDLAVFFKDKNIHFDFSARDGQKGTVNADADVHLAALPSFAASIRSSNFLALHNDLTTTSLNTNLVLRGNTQHCQLSGDVRVNSAQFRLSQAPASSVPSLEIQEIDSLGNVIGKEKKIRRNSPLDLNVNISIPNQFFIRGRGLESEWKGSVLINGNASTPSLTGGFEIVRGKYLFAGRDFLFASGEQNRIQFVGDFPPNPSVHVTAISKIDDLLVKLQVQGVVRNFSFSLLSEPILPEDEILARILFGRSLDNISPIQSIYLAQTLTHLTGAGKNNFDLISGIRTVLGVDTFKIEENKDRTGGLSVGVGKYLTEKIYVEFEKSPTEGEDSLSVEMEMSPHLSLDTKIGGTEGKKIELQWKIDY